MTTTYAIESEHGEYIGEGIQTVEAATRAARQTARRTGRTFYVVGGDLSAPIEIAPSAWRVYPVDAAGEPVGGKPDFDAAGPDENRFVTEAEALAAAESLAASCPVEDGGRWAVIEA